MQKCKSLPLMMTLFLALVIVLCGSVLAYMFTRTEVKENVFTPAEVKCEVVETFDGTNKTSVKIKNTGNIDAYLRLRLVSYWVDDSGNIVAKPSEMPTVSMASGWVAGTVDNTYYYVHPVAPNAMTDELLASQITLKTDSEGNRQVLEVFAEAIQSKPVEAVTSSWGVTMDSDGETIESAP